MRRRPEGMPACSVLRILCRALAGVLRGGRRYTSAENGVPPGRDRNEPMKAGTPEGGGDLYRAYLTVSGDAIARFELDEPLPVDASEDEQVDRLARHSRIAECNDIFAQLYDQTAEAMEGRLLADFMPRDDPGRLRGFREFVRARYRLVQAEEMHTLSDTYIRWVSGSALGVIEEGHLRS